MARSVKVDLILEATKYIRGAKDAKAATKGVTDSLVDAAKAGDSTAKATDSAADAMKRQASAAAKLDRDIDGLKGSLKDLSTAFALAGDEASKLDISKKIRAQQGELRKSLNARKLLGDVGEDAALGFAARFSGRVGPLLVSSMPKSLGAAAGPMAAVGAGIGIAVGVSMSAAIAGAITGAAGGAGVVAGLVIASKDPRVQSAGKRMADNIGRQLQDAAAPFVPAALKAINIVDRGFGDLGDEMRDVFSAAAGYVEPLVRGLMGAVREFAPGFRKAVEAAKPVIDVIASRLPNIGGALGGLFATMAEHAKEGAAAIEYLMAVAEVTIDAVAALIGKLASGFKYLDIFTSVARGDLSVFAKYMEVEASGAAGEFSGRLQGLAGAFQKTGDKAATAKVEVRSFVDQIRGIGGPAITAEQAMISFEAAIDDATAAIKENGKTLDRGTEKGRANRSALVNIASAARDAAAAVYEQTGSQSQANAVLARARTALYNQARAAGYSKEQAQALTGQLLGIPNVKREVDVNTKTASLRTSDLKERLNSIPNPQRTVTVNTGNSERRVESLQERIDNLHGKTVTITVLTRNRIDARTGGNRAQRWGGIDYHMAAGGMIQAHVAKSPTVLYGERATGAEAFIPMNGDRRRSMAIWEHVGRNWLRALPTSGSRPAVNVTNHFTINAAPNQSVRAIAEEVSRIQGRQANVYAR